MKLYEYCLARSLITCIIKSVLEDEQKQQSTLHSSPSVELWCAAAGGGQLTMPAKDKGDIQNWSVLQPPSQCSDILGSLRINHKSENRRSKSKVNSKITTQ